MAAANSPSYYQSGPCQEVKQKEHLFHLYMYQHIELAPGTNQKVILNPRSFGVTAVIDWEVRDGLASDANIVARAQGMALQANMIEGANNWFISHNMLFSDERFKGSSLQVLGSFVNRQDKQWAVVGGTGEFANASGVVNIKVIQFLPETTGVIRELNICASCPCVPNPTPVTKMGPWGGNGGTSFDIPDIPLSIQTVTIRCNDVINSLAFSYVNQAGQKKNVGPWGGDGALAVTITLAPSEIVKQVTGTTNSIGGDTVVTSLALVTNVTTYGPFGKPNGTPFSSQVPDNSSIVGFYALAGESMNALGAYVSPN